MCLRNQGSQFPISLKRSRTQLAQDFRSSTGLYKTGSLRNAFRTRLQSHIPHAKEQLQTLGTLSELCLHAQPNATHHLLVHLFQLKLLCRSYTQNVDDLDAKAGLPQMDGNGRRVHVTLHGSLKYGLHIWCSIKTCSGHYTTAP